MNAALYYSNTDESKRIAEYIAEQTHFALTDLTKTTEYVYEYAVAVFPVHCQNVPQAVKNFLRRLQTKYLVLIAAYGKMSYGNALYEIQRNYRLNIIAAAYVPTKHSYADEPRFEDFYRLAPVIDKIKNPTQITIPRSNKNIFANFLPKLRSQIGCKIVKDKNLCNNCGLCSTNCLQNAIKDGKTNRRCIRCTRCVQVCPQRALTVKLRPILKNYLKKPKTADLLIYV